MIINIGVFTFVAMIGLLICAHCKKSIDEVVVCVCWCGIVPLFIASLICFCNPTYCNIDLGNIIRIKTSSSQTDEKVAELKYKYIALLNMKVNQVK